MIVLWGLADDPILAAIAAALAERRAPVLFVDQRDGSGDFEFCFGGAETGADGHVRGIPLSHITAVYLRPHSASEIQASQGWPEDSTQAADSAAFTEAFLAWTEITDALVVNRLSAQASNMSKPGQALAVAAHGFAVPHTLVTTDPPAARGFLAAHPAAIAKSISGVRSIVRRIDAGDIQRLADVRHCPTQFQEYVPGTDYRVHVVGDDVFAVLVHSEADDYRYDPATERLPVTLPADVTERCRALARHLGLAVAGIDLRRTPDGRWVCFEANPSPGFTYFDDGSITEAVADLLCAAPNRRTPPLCEAHHIAIPGCEQHSALELLSEG